MRETPPAVSAGVRPLSRVYPAVNLESARLAEALPAVRAAVGPGARVHVEMNAQVAVRVERAAAFGAQEAARLGRVLGALMLQQLRRPGERGAAVHARQLLQALLLHVALLMAQELGAGGERALAGQGLGGVVQLCTRHA